MNATQVRRKLKKRIDGLPNERLQVAEDFLAYLEERESNEATEELLRIPGFIEALEAAKKEIAQGHFVEIRTASRKGRRVQRAS